MVFERPNRPNRPNPSSSSNRPNPSAMGRPSTPRKRDGGGGNRNVSSGHGSGGNNEPPSPWLTAPPNPDPSASFVEYLRWMREADHAYKDPTKIQILQMAIRGDYRDRLQKLTNRTKLIAGENNWFEVQCPWRIRVGGHRGPESILLPAFDALGMPYIPSSTLRGVARTQGIRHFMEIENLTWKEAEQKISPYFGSLDAERNDRAGKVIFLDAYPLPSDKVGGLSVDIANNIWGWDGDTLQYSPNPNPFLSLQKAHFLVGIRKGFSCNSEVFEKVRHWLLTGLTNGTGSQVNSGYGQLIENDVNASSGAFLSLKFSLEGQLIHGRQQFTRYEWKDHQNRWQMRGQPKAEVRATAFKSMLRYWFRAFSQGLLPAGEVQRWEAQIFGSIKPQTWGWITVNIVQGKLEQQEPQSKKDSCGEQSGILLLKYSDQVPQIQRKTLETVLTHLTWMMFHLGGIGQGARRPCYSRQNRQYAPWFRGSTLYTESDDKFWDIAKTLQGFQRQFQQNLEAFYDALSQLISRSINPRSPISVGQVRRNRWAEAVDVNCRIVVCAGDDQYGKPYGLAMLHHQDLKVKNQRGQLEYDGNLCGQVRGGVRPSPVWISDLGDYQVVTIFGATESPRRDYLEKLRSGTEKKQFAQIWPLQRT